MEIFETKEIDDVRVLNCLMELGDLLSMERDNEFWRRYGVICGKLDCAVMMIEIIRDSENTVHSQCLSLLRDASSKVRSVLPGMMDSADRALGYADAIVGFVQDRIAKDILSDSPVLIVFA